MPTPLSDTDAVDALAVLARDIDRVADRLRSMALNRLGAPVAGPGPAQTRAAGGQGAGTAARGARGCDRAPRGPAVPLLADAAAGDQVAVTGADLLAAAREAGPDPGAAAAVDGALAELRRVRAVL
jgi:hypothetical protein